MDCRDLATLPTVARAALWWATPGVVDRARHALLAIGQGAHADIAFPVLRAASQLEDGVVDRLTMDAVRRAIAVMMRNRARSRGARGAGPIGPPCHEPVLRFMPRGRPDEAQSSVEQLSRPGCP